MGDAEVLGGGWLFREFEVSIRARAWVKTKRTSRAKLGKNQTRYFRRVHEDLVMTRGGTRKKGP